MFALASAPARALVGEVEVVREAVRHVAGGGGTELPELTPPLEELKHEVLALATDFQAQQQRLQERLDTARQQIFFLTNHDALTGLANRKTLEERLETVLATARGTAPRTRCSTSTSTSSTASTTPSATSRATSCCAASCRC